MIGPLRFRSRTLVATILSTVYDEEDLDATTTQWSELVDAFTSTTHDRKTVDGTLRDLVRFGALERVGHYAPRNDTRAVRPTTLGRAWLDRVDMPEHPDDD